MRCDKHPDTEAVGSCVSCGQGICENCKVSISDMMHCKQCIEAGRIVGQVGQQQAQQQAQARPALGQQFGYQQPPYTPYPFQPAYGFPGPTEWKPEVPIDRWYGQRRPDPKGRPSLGLFKIGSMGSVTGAIASAVMSVNVFLGLVQGGSLFGSILLFFAMVPFMVGLYGFYRNYGLGISVVSIFMLTVGMTLFLATFALYDFDDWYYDHSYYGYPWYYMLAYLVFGTGVLLTGITFHQAKAYVYPLGDMRSMYNLTTFGMVTASILFFIVGGTGRSLGCAGPMLTIASWIVHAVSIFGFSSLFNNAPIPVISEQQATEVVPEYNTGGP
jgi:hypothetical protein